MVAAVALAALAGGLFGPRLLATEDEVEARYRVFTAALAAVEAQYVGPVESDRLVYSSINGLLNTLDPHSSFFDPRSYAQMRERQEGHYYGLGITIQSIDGDILVGNVFEGSPAFKRGIRRVLDRSPVPVVPLALRGLWGSFFSRKGGAAMTRPFRRGLFTRIEVVAGPPLLPEEVTPERLQEAVAALRGDWR